MRSKFGWCAALFIAALIVGCEDHDQKFIGQVQSNIVNGRVNDVTVTFPVQNSAYSPTSIKLTTRNEADALISELESMIFELKDIRDRMEVVEPTPEPSK